MPRFVRPASSSKRSRALVAAAVVVFTIASAYLSLVILSRVQHVFFPGNTLSVPGAPSLGKLLPGVDTSGDSGTQRRITILIMGADNDFGAAGWQSGLTHSDSIEVLTIDPKTKSATTLGIPRDLWVTIPHRSGGTYQDRVDTPLAVGVVDHYPEGGIGLEREVIENNLHITIDHYLMINYEGFIKVIDALGGIDIDVPNEVYDPYYSETELPGDYKPQHFYPGMQHMSGQTALDYARIRFSSDDLDRIRRQQLVIFAALKKAQSLDVLSHATTLWTQYKDTIQTDISDWQIPGYAALANQIIDGQGLRAVSLGPYTTPYVTAAGADVLLGNWPDIQRVVDSVFNDKGLSVEAAPTATPVRVDVENGTGEAGLAARVADYLASKGYPRSELVVSNAPDGQTTTSSAIIDSTGTHHQAAYLLASWLHISAQDVHDATASERSSLPTGAELVIIVGSDITPNLLQTSTTPASRGG